MVNGPLFGIGLGGAVQQANEMSRINIAERGLELQEQQFRSQQMAAQQEQVFTTAENLIKQIVDAKKASGLPSEEFNRKAARTIQQTRDSLSRTTELARANNIQVPDFGERLQQALDLTKTAGETAVTAGQTQATQQVAQAQTLVEFGIPDAQALQAAGVPAGQVQKVQTDIGKLIQDQEIITERFGADSPQAQAIQEALNAKVSGETRPDFGSVPGLRKEFTNASSDFRNTLDAFDRVKFAAENESAAGDVALIFGFMKMLDPGSTVREGEFATAQQAAGVPQQIVGLYNRAVNGQRLTETQRSDFFNQTKGIFRNQLSRQIGREEEFGRIAAESGFPVSTVIVDFRQNVTPEDISFATTPSAPQDIVAPIANETDDPLADFDPGAILEDLRGLPADQLRQRLNTLPVDQQRAIREQLQGNR